MSKLQITIACLVLVASIASGLAVLHPEQSFAETRLTHTRIIFVSTRDGDQEIYMMNADGSDVKQLTHNDAHDYYPSWSPDGTRIAFYSDRDGETAPYIMNADGSGQTKATSYRALRWGPGWSPDGSKFAYMSSKDGNWEIYVEDSDGTNRVRLTNDISADQMPIWSPDSRQIAFRSFRDGNWEIYRVNVDGSGLIRLTDDPADDYLSGWQPGGDKIAFTSYRGQYGGQIYIMNSDGSAETALTEWNPDKNEYHHDSPSWSPDGFRIAYVATKDQYNQIFVMRKDGSGKICISDGQGDDYSPQWEPSADNLSPVETTPVKPPPSTTTPPETTFSTIQADLEIMGVNWSPPEPVANEEVKITVTIGNQGNGEAGYSYLYFISHDRQFYTPMSVVDRIAPNTTVTKTIVWTPLQSGDYEIEVLADYSNTVPESNEDNNSRQIKITVGAPPVTTITPTPAPTTTYAPTDMPSELIIDNEYAYINFDVDAGDIVELKWKYGSNMQLCDLFWNDVQPRGPTTLHNTENIYDDTYRRNWRLVTKRETANSYTLVLQHPVLGEKTLMVGWGAGGIYIYGSMIIPYGSSLSLGGHWNPGGNCDNNDYYTAYAADGEVLARDRITYPGGYTTLWTGNAGAFTLQDMDDDEVIGYIYEAAVPVTFGSGASADGPFAEVKSDRLSFQLLVTSAGEFQKALMVSPPTPGPTPSYTPSVRGTPLSSGTISGEISVPGETDVYSFEGKAGDVIFITLADAGESLEVILTLYDPNGKVIKFYSSKTAASINLELPLNGMYVVEVSDDSPLPQTGPYTLSFNMVSEGKSLPIIPGVAVGNILSIPGEAHYYSFKGKAGDLAFIILADAELLLNVTLSLYDPEGTRIGSSSDEVEAIINTALPLSGIYIIKVNDENSPPQTGLYTLSFNMVSGGNILSITSGSIISNTLSRPGEAHYYSFEGKTNNRVFIKLTDAERRLNVVLTLYGPDGVRINLSTNDAVASINTVLPLNGTYIIRVSDGSSPRQSGPYMLSFEVY